MLNVSLRPNTVHQSFGLFSQKKGKEFDTERTITNSCIPGLAVKTVIPSDKSVSNTDTTRDLNYDEAAFCRALDKLHKRIKDHEMIVENRTVTEDKKAKLSDPWKTIKADVTIGEEKFKAEVLYIGDRVDLNVKGEGREMLEFKDAGTRYLQSGSECLMGNMLIYTDPDGKRFVSSLEYGQKTEGIRGNIVSRFKNKLICPSNSNDSTGPDVLPDPVNYNSPALAAIKRETQMQLNNDIKKGRIKNLFANNTDDNAYYEYMGEFLKRIKGNEIRVENKRKEKVIPENVSEVPDKDSIKADVTVGQEKFQVELLTKNKYFEDLIIRIPDSKESLEFHENSFKRRYYDQGRIMIPEFPTFVYITPEGKRYNHETNYSVSIDQDAQANVIDKLKDAVINASYN